jgi:hypothetical protein
LDWQVMSQQLMPPLPPPSSQLSPGSRTPSPQQPGVPLRQPVKVPPGPSSQVQDGGRNPEHTGDPTTTVPFIAFPSAVATPCNPAHENDVGS